MGPSRFCWTAGSNSECRHIREEQLDPQLHLPGGGKPAFPTLSCSHLSYRFLVECLANYVQPEWRMIEIEMRIKVRTVLMLVIVALVFGTFACAGNKSAVKDF